MARRWGYVAEDVAELAGAPKRGEQAEAKYLTFAQLHRVVAATQQDRLEARWLVQLTLGLRQGEVLGLRWADVDLDAGAMRIRQALQRQARVGLVFVEPKSRAGKRTLALPRPLVDLLRAHRSRQLEERLRAGSEWHDMNLIFTTPVGKPIDPSDDRKAWKVLLERAGVPHVGTHAARHTAATMLLAQGQHPRAVMETLGHSQISLTMNTYSHVIDEVRRDVADAMERTMWPTAQEGER